MKKLLLIFTAALTFLVLACLLFFGERGNREAAEADLVVSEAVSGQWKDTPLLPNSEQKLSFTAPPVETSAEISPMQNSSDSPAEKPFVTVDARQLNIQVLVDGIHTTAPIDDNYYTLQSFEGGAKMQLFTDEEIGSLYFVWEQLPEEFMLIIDGQEYRYSGDKYLHQFIILPQAGADVTVKLPEHRTYLCDIYAFSIGNPPDWVQQWTSLGEEEYADLLLFPTHADDEFLFFGGIIPYYAGELGLKVQVIYMNRHLGNEWCRNHELLNGLWTGGDKIYPIINNQRDYPMGSVWSAQRYYSYDNFVSFQVEQIRRFQPKVIVGHDLNGEYGHPTHIFNSRCLIDAVSLAADSTAYPESFEKYGIWDTPKLYFHLYPENQICLDFETPLDAFGGKTAYEAAQEAYGYYWTQHQYYFDIYGTGTAYDCHLFGLYRSVVGLDSSPDFMSNLT